MSAGRIAKRSSTQRRHDAIVRIRKLGRQFFEMGRCTPCIVADSPCWMLEGQSLCSGCKQRNKKVGECDGCFSVSEFDNLQDQREKLQADVERKDREIGLLIDALTRSQKEKG